MAKDKSIKKQLAGLDGWDETPEKSFEDVDPGKYQVKIDAATINNAKSSGRLQVSWEMTILNGKFAGRKLFKHDGLDTEDGRSYFRGTLARLGHEWPDDPSDLPDVLEELIETCAAVSVRKRKDSDSVNVYFDKALDSDDVDMEVEETEEAEETEEETEESVTADDVRAMKKKELKAFAKENGLKCDWDEDLDDLKDGIIEALELSEAEEEEAEAEAEEAEEETEEELTADEVNAMTKKQLKALVKERELDVDLTEEIEDIKIAVIEELGLESEAEEEEEEEAEEEEIVCNVLFKAKAVDKALKSKFTKMAKEADLDPADYDDITDMLIELAEYHGISGDFKKPELLLKALKKK